EHKKQKVLSSPAVGHAGCHARAAAGPSRRSRLDVDTQMIEYAVLDYLAMADDSLETTLRSATGAGREVLENLVRKKWIARRDASSARDARRTFEGAVRKEISGELSDNQQKIMRFLQSYKRRITVHKI